MDKGRHALGLLNVYSFGYSEFVGLNEFFLLLQIKQSYWTWGHMRSLYILTNFAIQVLDFFFFTVQVSPSPPFVTITQLKYEDLHVNVMMAKGQVFLVVGSIILERMS